MPNPLVVHPERQRELEADTLQSLAEGYERLAKEGIEEAFLRAARAWQRIAEAYAPKIRSERYEDDRHYYLCRAALAWLAVARNYAKAEEHAANKVDATGWHTKSVAAYREAGRLFEGCAKSHVERGALIEASGDFEQAQVCYERCGDTGAAARVERLAARIVDAIEFGTLKED